METGKIIKEITHSLPENCKLLVVSKTRSIETIMEAYLAGQRLFGENKVQELVQKHESLPPDIQWHMIGHLQTNKVKYIAPFIHTIQSVDSLKLLKVINNEAVKNNRIINFMFQLYIATEETKFGLSCNEIEEILQSSEFLALKNVLPTGLMGMASFTDNTMQVAKEFSSLGECFNYLRLKYFKDVLSFRELSMGMSSDYKIALEHGSTMIRLGSTIFGERI